MTANTARKIANYVINLETIAYLILNLRFPRGLEFVNRNCGIVLNKLLLMTKTLLTRRNNSCPYFVRDIWIHSWKGGIFLTLFANLRYLLENLALFKIFTKVLLFYDLLSRIYCIQPVTSQFWAIGLFLHIEKIEDLLNIILLLIDIIFIMASFPRTLFSINVKFYELDSRLDIYNMYIYS